MKVAFLQLDRLQQSHFQVTSLQQCGFAATRAAPDR
jgi:hypothetical protein